jgi:hypothetical protein
VRCRRVTTSVAGVLLALAALASCTSEIAGDATPLRQSRDVTGSATSPAPSTAASVTASSAAPGSAPPAPGQCLGPVDLTPVDCAGPHHVELTRGGEFDPGLSATVPDQETVFQAAFPDCRDAAAEFLGSTEYDVTPLGAWIVWPDAQDWARGERWYRCGVAHIGVDGRSEARTGSAEGVLADEGLYQHQICSAVRPSRHAVQRVPCTRAHVAEAIAVVPMGDPGDPPPTPEEYNRAAEPECDAALRDYLGGSRPDVSAAWRWPGDASWRQGFNNVTCYAETETPVTASLRNLGPTAPLPT